MDLTQKQQLASQVRALLEESTQAAAGSLESGQVLKELDGWDSLGVVMFIGLVLEQLAVELSVHEIRECARVADLEALVAARAGART